MGRWMGMLLLAGCCLGCTSPTNVGKERDTLTQLDKDWAASVSDTDKFMAFYAPDASFYAPGMPVAKGMGPIREAITKMKSAPGFSLQFAPAMADVSAAGDMAYTSGTYQAMMNGSTETGKYITVWKKQAAGEWKVKEDIFNADAASAGAGAPTAHAMVEAASIKWGDPPPSLPPGSKMAVIAGDPSKPGPFVIRAQVPAGYKIAPHWHPGDENLTILSGTVALGMGETWDESKMQSVGVGGYAALPAEMRHYFLAKTPAIFQVHGMGPFVVNYVNPADDPSKKAAAAVEKPSIDPATGVFFSAVNVKLRTKTPGTMIRYTIDGTDPISSSKAYTGPFGVYPEGIVRVKARAFKNGMTDSAVAAETYMIVPPMNL